MGCSCNRQKDTSYVGSYGKFSNRYYGCLLNLQLKKVVMSSIQYCKHTLYINSPTKLPTMAIPWCPKLDLCEKGVPEPCNWAKFLVYYFILFLMQLFYTIIISVTLHSLPWLIAFVYDSSYLRGAECLFEQTQTVEYWSVQASQGSKLCIWAILFGHTFSTNIRCAHFISCVPILNGDLNWQPPAPASGSKLTVP